MNIFSRHRFFYTCGEPFWSPSDYSWTPLVEGIVRHIFLLYRRYPYNFFYKPLPSTSRWPSYKGGRVGCKRMLITSSKFILLLSKPCPSCHICLIAVRVYNFLGHSRPLIKNTSKYRHRQPLMIHTLYH